MQHRKGNPVPITDINPAVPKEAVELVASMMTVEPEDRLQTMVDVRDSIRKLLGKED